MVTISSLRIFVEPCGFNRRHLPRMTDSGFKLVTLFSCQCTFSFICERHSTRGEMKPTDAFLDYRKAES